MNPVPERKTDQLMLEDALALYEQGFHVIPLGAYGEMPPANILERSGNNISKAKKQWPKQPRIGWAAFQKRQSTEKEIKNWWRRWPNANIGIVTGINVNIIDADSADAIEWVENNLQKTPWKVKTGRGMQFYYQVNDKILIRNSVNADRKIDIRGIGGYVVAPPSVHWTGAIYEWILDDQWRVNSVYDLPALSQEDMNKINLANQCEGDFGDLSQVKLPADGSPVPHGERDNSGASLAGKFIRAGASLSETEQALKEWNSNNPEPLSDGEITKITASVANTHLRNHPEDEIPIGAEPPKTDGLSIFDWHAGLYKGKPKPRQWLINNLIPASKPIMIAAIGDVGKSFLIIDLAFNVATGGEHCAIGGDIGTHGTAVIFTSEDDFDEILRRISDIDPDGNRHKAPEKLLIVPLPDAGGPFQIVTMMMGRPTVTKEFRHIRKQLLSIDDLALVVFDPLQAFIAADISSDTTAGQFVCSLAGELAAETGACVLFSHHMRKLNKPIANAADARDAVRGTTALVDGVRCVFALWKEQENAEKVCQALNVEYKPDKVVKGAVVKCNAPVEKTIKTYIRNDYGLLIDHTELLKDTIDYDEQTGTYNALEGDEKLTSERKERIGQIVLWIKLEENGLTRAKLTQKIKDEFDLKNRMAQAYLKLISNRKDIITELDGYGRIIKYRALK